MIQIVFRVSPGTNFGITWNNSDSLELNSDPKLSPGDYFCYVRWWRFRIEIKFEQIKAILSNYKISFRTNSKNDLNHVFWKLIPIEASGWNGINRIK